MNLPETHYHFDHLPPIDQHFVKEAETSVYQWPKIDFEHGLPITTTTAQGTIKNHGFPIPTPDCTQYGVEIPGQRHSMVSRTIQGSQPSSFANTKFAQDLVANLGKIKCRYMYNQPWSMYDWHQDLAGHHSSINFLLTETPGARTLHRFPTDCRLNYKVVVLEYKLYRPVLFNAKVDHCIINMTDKDRYILSVLLLDSSYEKSKDFLSNYKLDTSSYL